ncbi:hypothetical protein RD055328_12300 [Companilactobacillus sp. RD055328]|uniref:WxL domain-containing protein n=1 Tax=Companilactobacillus sp. RD055328 TaxID=2916634 RepID=UPI001FC8A12E|nr:WxL domain-containing protein [Companilactobacillus sp. RD055328]GKQ43307.1 hypothetical protein RD055328_12300 [Companilactobacillus sp. RD055328]
MKKMTLATAALTAMIATSTTTSVLADTKVDDLNRTSEGTVNVTAGGDGENGALQLVKVPDLDFGTIKLGDAATQVTTDTNEVTTSDLRGTKDGWELSVKYQEADATAWQNADKSVSGSGFILELPALAYADASGTTNVGEKPTVSAVAKVSDKDAVIATADGSKLAGKGVFTGTFAQADTKLTVPANNQAVEYKSTLVWTLKDVPATN